MTPFEVTVLSVTLNAAGIVPSANNRFPLPNKSGCHWHKMSRQPARFSLEVSTLREGLSSGCVSGCKGISGRRVRRPVASHLSVKQPACSRT